MTTFEISQHVTYNNKRWAIFAISKDSDGKIILMLKRDPYRIQVPAEEVTL